ncbi:MAG: TlpA disulfide reductase family protein [Lascolabacillus sp.]|uniref:TlpA disulfide reductase family protein n=1 Tax=Lascolabacillus sp. TaxID=1924068 RepID=UPI00258AC293|nr:TlpA disulfide reductase family protein [Lascolabacillus sp.]MDD2607926.1 TlpA disulfide reductase family protein [Lascolabacillus sp.]MDD3658573.1 TlpA disulfide reductase family protein [Lascolabacillus sp.]
MKTVIRRFAVLTLIIGCVFVSCKKGDIFSVEGNIQSAEGDTLYLEHRGLAGIVLLDSAILNDKGSFKFKEPAPKNPEFYQLRIRNKVVAFAVDSVESLRVTADASNLYGSFTVEDSYSNDQLRKVDDMRMKTEQEINSLEKLHTAKEIDDITFLNSLDSVLTLYKKEISNLIIGNPSSAAAYYAVFQKINDYLIFDPYDKKDYPMFGAVATSWNRYYPETERTTHLYNFTVNALQTRRQLEKQEELFQNITVETESGLPDISLPGVNGERISLSSLKGKVVLLDFVVYSADFSPKHNIDLNSLYQRYNSRGFEIYQVSFDSNEHFWKTSADNLPWVTVRDPRSVSTPLLSLYNVREIPTSFIIDREGDLIGRVEDYSQLSEQLDKVL